MKRFLFSTLIGTLLATGSLASDLRAKISNSRFNVPDGTPYVETTISVKGNSVTYKKINATKYQGSILITIICKQEAKIVHVEKYNLLTPELSDTLSTAFNFLDQKRIPLANGKYQMEIEITDNNNPNNKAKATDELNIDFNASQINMSDIVIIESYKAGAKQGTFNRNGYEMTPYPDNFFPTNQNKLIFYDEIYNTQKVAPGESFLLSYYLQNQNNSTKLEGYHQNKKVSSQNVIVLFNEFDIAGLASGNYELVVELRNKMNEIIDKKTFFFQRSNKAMPSAAASMENIDVSFASGYNLEQMSEHLKSLFPIASSDEREYIKKLLINNDLVSMQKYLVYFFQKRNTQDAAGEWSRYEQEVRKVNQYYSSKFTKGYDTDRGYVYLKFGPPNNIRKNAMDNITYPYEIWQYYQVSTYSNRRFVFYSPDNLPNEMQLIHSNLPGERYDPQWKYKILSRTQRNATSDNDPDIKYFGDKLEQDFNE